MHLYKKKNYLLIHTCICYLLVITCFSIPCNAYAASAGLQAPTTYINFVSDPVDSYDTFLPVYHISQMKELYAQLPTTLSCITTNYDETICEVVWDTSSLSIGRNTLIGTLSSIDNLPFLNDTLRTVSLPLYLYEDSPTVVIAEADPILLNPSTVLLEVGHPLDVLQLETYIECFTSYHEFVRLGIEYDLSGLDVDTIGTYMIPRSYTTIPGIDYDSNNIQLSPLPVCVMEPDVLKLDCYSISGTNLFCEWLKPLDKENMSVEYAIGNGAWQKDVAYSGYSFAWYSKSFMIDLTTLVLDTDYYFRVQGNNEYSNILHIKLDKDPTQPPLVEHGGNRDGADAAEPAPPPLNQVRPTPPDTSLPAAEEPTDIPILESDNQPDSSIGITPKPSITSLDNPQEETSSDTESTTYYSTNVLQNTSTPDSKQPVDTTPAKTNNTSTSDKSSTGDLPVMEEVTEDTTTISGARLNQMLEHYVDTVPFAANDIVIRIPASFLHALQLGDNDLLSISLLRKDDTNFEINITANNKQIIALEETQVQIAIDNDCDSFTLFLAGEKLPTVINYENGYASFPITQTGSYELCTPEKADAPSTSIGVSKNQTIKSQKANIFGSSSYLFCIIGFIALLILSYVAFKKRK